MVIARVSKKGRITLPAELAGQLGIGPKTRVEIEVNGDVLTVRPVESVREDSSLKPEDGGTVQDNTGGVLADGVISEHPDGCRAAGTAAVQDRPACKNPELDTEAEDTTDKDKVEACNPQFSSRYEPVTPAVVDKVLSPYIPRIDQLVRGGGGSIRGWRVG